MRPGNGYYLGLIRALVVSELKLRYKNSILGFVWSFLYPFILVLILLLVFTKMFSYDMPSYPSYLLIGMFIWNFFSEATAGSLRLFVDRPNLIKKIYFPRLLLIFSHTVFRMVEFLIKFFFLIVLMIVLGIAKDWNLIILNHTSIVLVLLIFLEFMFIVGISSILSSLYAFLRDVSHLWNALLMLGFFITPIFYPESIIPENYSFIVYLNPMHHLIACFRKVLIEGSFPDPTNLLVFSLYSLVLFWLGFMVLNRLEKRIAENV